MVEATTNKNGEDVIQTYLRRTTQGLLVTIKAHPKVEEFMRRYSGGEIAAITAGRQWYTEWTDPITKQVHVINPEPLKAYVFPTRFEPFRSGDGMLVDLDKLGQPLLNQVNAPSPGGIRLGNGEEELNMSFLRLVGISNPDGVKFMLRTVYSTPAVRRLRDLIQNGQNSFSADYLKTLEYCVTTATQTF